MVGIFGYLAFNSDKKNHERIISVMKEEEYTEYQVNPNILAFEVATVNEILHKSVSLSQGKELLGYFS